MGVYRPPKQSGNLSYSHYLSEYIEEELNCDICTWASLKYQTYILIGDLNVDRRRPECREGNGMYDHQTERVTPVSGTLIDIILANNLHVWSLGISWSWNKCSWSHLWQSISFCVVAQKRKQSHSEVSKMLSNFDELNRDLASAPWNLLEMYDSVDEQYNNWKTIFESV